MRNYLIIKVISWFVENNITKKWQVYKNGESNVSSLCFVWCGFVISHSFILNDQIIKSLTMQKKKLPTCMNIRGAKMTFYFTYECHVPQIKVSKCRTLIFFSPQYHLFSFSPPFKMAGRSDNRLEAWSSFFFLNFKFVI